MLDSIHLKSVQTHEYPAKRDYRYAQPVTEPFDLAAQCTQGIQFSHVFQIQVPHPITDQYLIQ